MRLEIPWNVKLSLGNLSSEHGFETCILPTELTKCRLFAKGARNLELDQLREICGDYQHLNYAKGAVELPLDCAQAWDADNRGKEYWYAGCPSQDSRMQFWDRRRHCYDLILDSLSVFEERCQKTKPIAQSSALAAEGPDAVRSHAYELAFSSEDEMFHSTLYDWLIARGMADELLEVRRDCRSWKFEPDIM